MRRLPLFIIFSLMLLTGAFAAHAVVVKGYKVTQSSGLITLVVDSVDFRNNLTRVYAKLVGKPHISNRIDKIELTGALSHKQLVCTDVDGIDLNRWFQWEDDGSIAVEIDFPPCRNRKGVTMIKATGPKGISQWQIIRK